LKNQKAASTLVLATPTVASWTKTRDDQGLNTTKTVSDERIDELILKFSKYEKNQVTDGIRKQVPKEWIDRDGHEPDPSAVGDLEIFEGLVRLRMKELGLEGFHVFSDDLAN